MKNNNFFPRVLYLITNDLPTPKMPCITCCQTSVLVTQMYNKCTAEYKTYNEWTMRMYKTKIMKEKKKLKMITCKI